MDYCFAPAAWSGIPVTGERRRFPVHRIYCVGRNYADHAREMGADPTREPPFFFMKPCDAVVSLTQHDAVVPYPPKTSNFHHEVELVVAIGHGGDQIAEDRALAHVFGYAAGNELTRRDLQVEARKRGRPWDMGKAFDNSAAVTAIRPAEKGHVASGRIWLSVNGELRQEADIADMIWNVQEIIAELSTYVTLAPGDLIYTGTPAGVGPLRSGDRVDGGIEGLAQFSHGVG